jgi:hypothetical protein
MLADRYQQLLTAYVDGELSARQQRLVHRLLRRSSEARMLLAELFADASALRAIPPQPLGVDLSAAVVRAIASHQAPPRPTRRRPASTGFPAWVAVAVAAAVLVGLGVTSFLYFSSLRQPVPAGIVQHDPGQGSAGQGGPATVPIPIPPVPPATAAGPPKPTMRQPSTEPPPPPPIVVKRPPDTAPVGPSPSPEPVKPADVLTDRIEMYTIDRIELTLPVILKFSALDQEAGKKQLLGELRKTRDFRLELPCRNGSKGFESVHAVLKNLNATVLIEPTAQARLKRPQSPTTYAIYAEDVYPEDLLRLLELAGQEDRKMRKPGEHQLDRLVLTRMTALDRKELAQMMGADPTLAAAPAGVDPKTPLEDVTARHVVAALAGQGGPPRPELGKPAVRPPQRQVFVMAYEPMRADGKSAEAKRFLELRKPPRPGTLRVLLVFRS